VWPVLITFDSPRFEFILHVGHLSQADAAVLSEAHQYIKRRTHIVRNFPNAASCMRLVRALTAETHEDWIEGIRYLNMDLYREHKKLRLLQEDAAA